MSIGPASAPRRAKLSRGGALQSTAEEPMAHATITIPENEIVERFVRATGPGGQNVNKVSTAVELRFDVANSPSLPEPVRERLLARRDRRLTNDGVLVLSAQRFRTQERNRNDARERLAHFIESGLHAPTPRVATRPTRGSKERRLGAKRERSTIKRGRGNRDWD
jgi:ribosome-associated protein